jgi:hypothetical protein
LLGGVHGENTCIEATQDRRLGPFSGRLPHAFVSIRYPQQHQSHDEKED